MILLYQALYVGLLLVLARYNADLIKNDLKVRHSWNAWVHVIAWAFIALCLPNLRFDWIVLPALPFLGLLAFDTSLNLMRGRKWDYVTKTPTSRVDKAIIWLFGTNGALPKVLCIALVILFNVVYHFLCTLC